MKKNKGVTLTSLTIYVIGVLIIISILSTFSGFFYKNVDNVTIQDKYIGQYTKFTSFLTNDINSGKVNTVTSSTSGQNDYISIEFNDGIIHQYIYDVGKIYYIEVKNHETTRVIKMCSKVENLTGSKIFRYDSQKRQIDIKFSINQKEYSDTYYIT